MGNATTMIVFMKTHGYSFVAKPAKNADGSMNLMSWSAAVPGKKGTPWENGLYKLDLAFPEGLLSSIIICASDNIRIPCETPKSQIRTSLVPPKRLSFRYNLSINIE